MKGKKAEKNTLRLYLNIKSLDWHYFVTILLIAHTNMIQMFYIHLHSAVQLFAHLLGISRTIFIFYLIQNYFHILKYYLLINVIKQ